MLERRDPEASRGGQFNRYGTYKPHNADDDAADAAADDDDDVDDVVVDDDDADEADHNNDGRLVIRHGRRLDPHELCALTCQLPHIAPIIIIGRHGSIQTYVPFTTSLHYCVV